MDLLTARTLADVVGKGINQIIGRIFIPKREQDSV
jgi:hypothetical protein